MNKKKCLWKDEKCILSNDVTILPYFLDATFHVISTHVDCRLLKSQHFSQSTVRTKWYTLGVYMKCSRISEMLKIENEKLKFGTDKKKKFVLSIPDELSWLFIMSENLFCFQGLRKGPSLLPGHHFP